MVTAYESRCAAPWMLLDWDAVFALMYVGANLPMLNCGFRILAPSRRAKVVEGRRDKPEGPQSCFLRSEDSHGMEHAPGSNYSIEQFMLD